MHAGIDVQMDDGGVISTNQLGLQPGWGCVCVCVLEKEEGVLCCKWTSAAQSLQINASVLDHTLTRPA